MSTRAVALTLNDLDKVRDTRPNLTHALTAFSLVMVTAGTASLATVGRDLEWFGGTTAGVSSRQAESLSISPLVSSAPTTASRAERVSRLKAATGLTWDQVARLFGVSRRAVHQWVVGGRMNSHNTEVLAQLERILVTEVPAVDPPSRRAALFVSDGRGDTPFERALALRSSPDVRVYGNSRTALEQVTRAV